jgi:flagellar biosynthesis repressor protein FlbT
MSGLVLALAPNETVIVNGAVIENGDKPSRLRIRTADARVLRSADALHPSEVNTPAKRIYFAIQLFITGDLDESVFPAVEAECESLAHVFSPINSELIPILLSMLRRGNHYSALCHLRSIIAMEAELLNLNRSNALRTGACRQTHRAA